MSDPTNPHATPPWYVVLAESRERVATREHYSDATAERDRLNDAIHRNHPGLVHVVTNDRREAIREAAEPVEVRALKRGDLFLATSAYGPCYFIVADLITGRPRGVDAIRLPGGKGPWVAVGDCTPFYAGGTCPDLFRISRQTYSVRLDDERHVSEVRDRI